MNRGEVPRGCAGTKESDYASGLKGANLIASIVDSAPWHKDKSVVPHVLGRIIVVQFAQAALVNPCSDLTRARITHRTYWSGNKFAVHSFALRVNGRVYAEWAGSCADESQSCESGFGDFGSREAAKRGSQFNHRPLDPLPPFSGAVTPPATAWLQGCRFPVASRGLAIVAPRFRQAPN